MDKRWQLVLNCLECEQAPFGKGTLIRFRAQLIKRRLDRRLIERTVELAQETGSFGSRNLRAALDSSPLWVGAKVEDTYNLLGHALRKALGVIARQQGRELTEIAQEAGAEIINGSSLKAALDVDWDNPEERAVALDKGFTKSTFVLDWERQQITCPNQVTVPFQIGTKVQFPKSACANCPLQVRCTTSQQGRSVSIHPEEQLLQELRQRQLTQAGRAKLRQRVAVEHSLAHLGHWQTHRARYIGLRKNLFDLRRVAVVHNLHVWARLVEQAANIHNTG